MWKWIKILFYLSMACFAIGFILKGIGELGSNYHSKVQHPCPTLTKKFPILKQVDKYLMLTASVVWYSCIEKSTGKKYIVKFDYTDKYGERIYLFDDETRTRRYVTRKEYVDNYSQPIDGFSYDWDFPKIEEARKYKDEN